MYNVAVTLLLFLICSSCGGFESALDRAKYKSIIGKHGTIYTTLAGKLIEYKNMKIEYSESNSSTLLLSNEEGNFIYIQGPAIIQFYEKDFSTRSSIKDALEIFGK